MFVFSSDIFHDSDVLWEVLIGSAISVVSLNVGLRLGAWVYSSLKSRVRAARMFLWSLAALIPFAVCSVCCQMSGSTESLGYFFSILSGSCIAAYVAKSKDRTAGVIAALFAMLPIVLANFLNLVSTAFFWFLDSVDWQALASAAALNIVAVAAICAGGTIAFYLRKKEEPYL
jgi:hypothetical protein